MLNFNLVTMLNQLKTRKKLVVAVILGIVIVILIALPAKKSTPGTPSQPTQINIPALNPSIKPEAKTQLETIPEIKTVTVFESVKFTEEQILSFFNPIANEFKFSTNQEKIDIDRALHFYWESPPNFLTVNINTAAFTLDLHQPIASGSSRVSEIDALLFAQNWLQGKKLIDENIKVKTEYFQDSFNELVPISGSVPVDIYLFSFYPTINNLPIFTTRSYDAPITVTINKYGNIVSLYYRLPSLFFANQPKLKQVQKTILSAKQIQEKISNKEATIFSVTDADGKFVASTENLNNLTYRKVTLGYSNDFSLGYFLPVFQLMGEATLDNGDRVNVTAYLPALAD
jgi:hypothetical protein